ncbi:thrombospondin-3 isoform X6 [Microtus ochrogaster]|uniref:Thrombospondin-3 isoform X6 n=1 Tax=Microtus ochrogaster TaxID=79684 RepID=A0ABM1USX5_MICOH|nr:thrombospondin-3 isoform X6 [Microtus ochrogaster]
MEKPELWGALALLLVCFYSCSSQDLQVIDLLTLGESRQTVAVAEKIRTALLTAGDIYLLSTFRLPPKQGGVLFGLYSRQDNTRWLEASVVGKINKVLVRYQREDGKVHAVNLQQAGLADGRTHTALLRLRGPSRPSPGLQLYVDCKLGDQHAGLPALAPIPPAEVSGLEIRTGQKAYLRMQGFVESMKIIIGGSMARVGALSECPFQGDDSIHSAVTSALQSILGEQTKALVTQLTLFNQILVELRDDIRDQVWVGQPRRLLTLGWGGGCGGLTAPPSAGEGDVSHPEHHHGVSGFHEQRSHCSPNPCFRGVDCMEVYEYPGYRCGPCPPGLQGNGTHCDDINECAHSDPCFPGSSCINTMPGFHCEACPPGYKGTQVSGVGIDYARASKQVCNDIDECNDGDNGGCDPNSICTNTVGSFKCGPCRLGFLGNQSQGCLPARTCHSPAHSPCHVHAHCLFERNGAVSCQCNVGWAGNGNVCGPDTDIDGYPDQALPCMDNNKHCKQDNCLLTPNSGQEDADNDGVGDQCDDDADGDGIKNVEDNCRLFPNKDQQNSDTDSFGDACDNCPNVPNNDQKDTDGNGEGDACDNDVDGDGIPNGLDNCPKVPNPLQTDRDEDGVGDACDSCPEMSNPTQMQTATWWGMSVIPMKTAMETGIRTPRTTVPSCQTALSWTRTMTVLGMSVMGMMTMMVSQTMCLLGLTTAVWYPILTRKTPTAMVLVTCVRMTLTTMQWLTPWMCVRKVQRLPSQIFGPIRLWFWIPRVMLRLTQTGWCSIRYAGQWAGQVLADQTSCWYLGGICVPGAGLFKNFFLSLTTPGHGNCSDYE